MNFLDIITENFGLIFGVNNNPNYTIFGYLENNKSVFINSYGSSDNCFFTIEELYKFFKMDYNETTNFSKVNSKVTFNIPIETIKEDYIEFLSKKHNLIKESIELKILM